MTWWTRRDEVEPDLSDAEEEKDVEQEREHKKEEDTAGTVDGEMTLSEQEKPNNEESCKLMEILLLRSSYF